MRYIGVDLYKRLVEVCVVEVQDGKRVVVERGRWPNEGTAGMKGLLRAQVPFQLVVESTSCYEWFVELAEPLADRVVLGHPRKLRVIAESTRQTDRLDAQVLAEFLALGMIPEAHRGQRAGRTKQQSITNEGSRLLRWNLVEFAWRIVRRTRRWGFVYERLQQRRGAKRAIVAVARRLLGVIVSLLRSGKAYSLTTELVA